MSKSPYFATDLDLLQIIAHERREVTMIYPFTAIVGQSKMKTALLLNAINPAIGGVLIYGEKGTGKSTAAP